MLRFEFRKKMKNSEIFFTFSVLLIISKMDTAAQSTSFCRTCKKPFKNTATSREARKNIFKKDAKGVSLQSRMAKVGLVIHHELHLPNSICRPCENKIITLEKAELIKIEFGIISLPETDEPRTERASDLHESNIGYPFFISEVYSLYKLNECFKEINF